MDNLEAIYELAPIQEGMLFHTLLAPDAGYYIEQFHSTLHGRLDVELFAKAWRNIAARHAVLRTSFVWQESVRPIQRVHRRVELALDLKDWRSFSAESQTRQLEAYLESDRRRGFRLEEPPLMRLCLFHVEDSVFHFLWTFHHALLDGWSYLIVLKELFSLYESYVQNTPMDFATVRPYQDYIASRRGLDLGPAQDFWRDALRGFHTTTSLKLGTPAHTSDKEVEFGEEKLCLSRDLTDELRAFAKRHRLTLNTLLQGAWAMLLHRYSGDNDVVYGATVCGRPPDLEAVESMVGVFINTIPTRVAVVRNRAVLSWLRALQERLMDFHSYESTPLSVIRKCAELPPDQPLFDSIAIFENVPADRSLWEGGRSLKIRNVRFLSRTHYPLTLAAHAGAEMALTLSFRRDRFDDASIRRMLGHLRCLLQSLAADPWRPMGDLALLTPEENHRLLVEWNAPRPRGAREKRVHELFEAQAAKTPEAIAVIGQNTRLTYHQLDQQAEALSRQLQSLGVGPDVLVGLCLEPSEAMVVAVLGVLKAGGAYLPLDPHYPLARLEFALTDSRAGVLVTEEKLLDCLPHFRGRVVCAGSSHEPRLGGSACCRPKYPGTATRRPSQGFRFMAPMRDRRIEEARQQPRCCGGEFADELGEPNRSARSQTRPRPENLAYVIYTSGSTGRPKGVGIEHRSVTALLAWAFDTYSPDELRGVLASTSLCFDLSVFEFFAPLCSGGKVILAENLLHVPSLPAAGEITLINTVPSAMTELLRLGGVPASVRTVNLAGEPLPAHLARQIYETTQVARVFDLYGPTEDTVYSTAAVHRPEGPVTIGRPLTGEQIYLLDAQLRPVPLGVLGEIFIGGEGLARGYLNLPDRTAERFIPNPFSEDFGSRLYRTGDLARYLPDGNLEFLGRRDHQVKLRGYRIELGEIEAVLQEHPAVREAAVVVREISPGDQRLAACVVPNADGPTDPERLRLYLNDRLPAHMVPAILVFLDTLPRTPNGKVNRSALPSIGTTRTGAFEADAAPRTETEQVLASIWRTVLGIEQVGIRDNFFELGGHSLLVTRVIARVRAAFEIEVPIRFLFEAPTIAAFARVIERTFAHEANEPSRAKGSP